MNQIDGIHEIVNDGFTTNLFTTGAGSIINTGLISSELTGAVYDEDSVATDVYLMMNSGTISGVGPEGAFYGNGAIENISNSGSINGIISMSGNVKNTFLNSGVVNGNLIGIAGYLTNSGAINGSINCSAGSTVTDSGTITGSVTLNNGKVYLNSAQISVAGGGDTIVFQANPANDVANLSNTASNWDWVGGGGGYVNLANAQTSIIGGGYRVWMDGNAADAASLYHTNGD
jgi:hypothetical protein